MSKPKTSTKRIKRPTLDEFVAKHENDFAEDDDYRARAAAGNKLTLADAFKPLPWVKPSLSPSAMEELKQWWIIRMLKAAGMENNAEAAHWLLEYFFRKMTIRPPDGLFSPIANPPGRPPLDKTAEIANTWVLMGKPSIYTQRLAREIYGDQFSRAIPGEKKKMVDLCRKAVERHFGSTRLNLDSK